MNIDDIEKIIRVHEQSASFNWGIVVSVLGMLVSLFIAIYGWHKSDKTRADDLRKADISRQEDWKKAEQLRKQENYERSFFELIEILGSFKRQTQNLMKKRDRYYIFSKNQAPSGEEAEQIELLRSEIDSDVRNLGSEISDFTYGCMVNFHNRYHLEQKFDFTKDRVDFDDISDGLLLTKGVYSDEFLNSNLDKCLEKVSDLRNRIITWEYTENETKS